MTTVYRYVCTSLTIPGPKVLTCYYRVPLKVTHGATKTTVISDRLSHGGLRKEYININMSYNHRCVGERHTLCLWGEKNSYI